MDRREIAALLAYIGRLDPRTIRTNPGETRDQLAQWHELLGDVPMATPHGWDARVAARQHIRTSPYQILPADVARPWESYRRDRLARHSDPAPSVDPDDQAAWTAELVGARRAVAAGIAQPAQARAITSGRDDIDPRLEARLRAIGSCIPPAARAALAPYRPARAAREAAVAQGQPDALSVRCEWCLAQPGEPCRRRRIGPDGGARGTAPRATPHPGRLDLAAAQQAQQTEQVRQPAMA
ncbi:MULTISPECIES: zinc finger domain-containing protein [Streptomyces]|uniref:DNA-binding phage zinc finger domain-containing protein n=1 Tax=Streptomyces fimbriatus TaxID=68197 RepID=A0ABW0DDT1_STRFI